MIELKRSSIKDPEWWTSIAVDLLDLNLGSTAKNLSKLLKKSDSTISQSMIDLYVTTFEECFEGYKKAYSENQNLEIAIKMEDFFSNNLHKFDPLFPTHYDLFYQILDTIKKSKIEIEYKKTLEEWFRSEFSGYFDQRQLEFPVNDN